jgi:hypothetical protein
MTTLQRTATAAEIATPRRQLGTIVWKWMVTTDHKVIGNLYFVTSMVFFLFGGILAMAMRAELAFPGMQYLSYETFNQFFTMHGTIMLLLFATPLFAGFANAIMPLQIGAPDVAFPRLNMIAYWFYLFGGLIASAGFLSPSGAASFGWFAYAPLNDAINSPGVGGDLWIMGLYMAGLGTILGAVNFTTTILCMRAPGMTMFRMPIFTWNILVTSFLVLVVFPILAAALLVLEADRALGGGFAGVQPKADLRLCRTCPGNHADRRPVSRGVGAPHVRHRGGQPTVLLLHDLPDCCSDRRQVLQLGRHHVGWQYRHANAHALGGRIPYNLPVWWSDRHCAGQPTAGLRSF